MRLTKTYSGRKPLAKAVLFELFSGSGRLSDLAEGRHGGGHPDIVRVIAVDKDPRAKPDLVADLSTSRGLDLVEAQMRKAVEEGYLVIVHMSPPCTEYSMSKTTAPRQLTSANALVRRVLDLVMKYAVAWTLENPGTNHRASLWKQQGFPELEDPVTVDYCQLGYPIRKITSVGLSSKRHMKRRFERRDGTPKYRCDKRGCPMCVKTSTGAYRHMGHFANIRGSERSAMPYEFCVLLIKVLVEEALRVRQAYIDRHDDLLKHDEFEVERVLDHGEDDLYLVKWVGYEETTWENLPRDHPSVVEFWR
jgi:hypothetical protein